MSIIFFLIAVVLFLYLTGRVSWGWYMFKRKTLRRYYMWYTLRRADEYKKRYEDNPTPENLDLYTRAYLHWEISGTNDYLADMERTVGIRVCPKCQLPTRKDLCVCEYCNHKDASLDGARDFTAIDKMQKIFRESRLYKPDPLYVPKKKNEMHSEKQEKTRQKFQKIKCQCGAMSKIIEDINGFQTRLCRNGHKFTYSYQNEYFNQVRYNWNMKGSKVRG